MLDLTTIILTYNEERHIRRCLENVLKFSKKVIVIDSPSTDRTQTICREYLNVEIIEHKYPGNQAEQLNWALNNVNISTEWTLRLDADEYLSDELISEIRIRLPMLPLECTGILLNRDVIFMGKRIKHGKLKDVKLLRLWRTGKCYIEPRIMDEHAVLKEGTTIVFKNYFFDHNLNGIDSWILKHLDYANREVRLVRESELLSPTEELKLRDHQKNMFYRLPAFHRGFCFFILRYVLLGGFLDGKAGFLWNFMQCWWYRTLIDIKLQEYNTHSKKEMSI